MSGKSKSFPRTTDFYRIGGNCKLEIDTGSVSNERRPKPVAAVEQGVEADETWTRGFCRLRALRARVVLSHASQLNAGFLLQYALANGY